MALKRLGLLAVLLHPGAAENGVPTPQHPQFLQHQEKEEAKQGIVPALEPVSDEKFFKKDYPDDHRPGPYNHFGYPYPKVQDSDTFDKDYVEDRNDDNGYWKAQTEYDGIRNKLTKEIEEARRALAKEREEKKELEEAIEKEKIAEAEAVAAEKVEKKAEADHAKAEAELKALKKDIDESADHTDEEVEDLEGCKKKLKEIQKRLKEELADKAKREAAQKKQEEHERNLEGEEIDAMKKEEKLEDKIAREEEDKKAAQKLYDKELADVKAAEKEIEAAYIALMKLRHADPDGGVYEVAKGGAHQSMAFISASLVLILTQLFLM